MANGACETCGCARGECECPEPDGEEPYSVECSECPEARECSEGTREKGRICPPYFQRVLKAIPSPSLALKLALRTGRKGRKVGSRG